MVSIYYCAIMFTISVSMMLELTIRPQGIMLQFLLIIAIPNFPKKSLIMLIIILFMLVIVIIILLLQYQ